MKSKKKTVKKARLSKKQIAFLIGLIVSCLAIIGIIVYKLNNRENENQKLTLILENLGKDYYENSYYPHVKAKYGEKIDEFLGKYVKTGIKIDLENLAKYRSDVLNVEEEVAKFKTNQNNKECDKAKTLFVIYPSLPYGQNDYTYLAILSCDFEN